MNTSLTARPPSAPSRLIKRVGQAMVVAGLLTLVFAGQIQPQLAAMCSAQGAFTFPTRTTSYLHKGC